MKDENTNNKTNPKKLKTSVKRLIIISIVTLILGIASFVPYKHKVYKDGGTQEWRAVAYVKIRWNSLSGDDPSGTSVYFFPFSFLPSDVIFDMETK